MRLDRGGSAFYYVCDGLGSVRALTDAGGAVTDTWAYDAWGNQVGHTGSTANPFLFTGQQQDASGLYYLRARYYAPGQARFLSQDSFGGSSEEPISLHKYLYAGDDPLDNVDPSGREADSIEVTVSSQITAGLAGTEAADVEAGIRATTEIDEVAQQELAEISDINVAIDEQLDTVGRTYSPLDAEQPLSEQEASSFKDSIYMEKTPNQDTILYRVYGSGRNPLGSYWSRVSPRSVEDYRNISAITRQMNPDLANSRVVTMRVPPRGTTFYEGLAEKQPDFDPATGEPITLPGGGNQVYTARKD